MKRFHAQRLSVIHIAWGEHKVDHLPAVVGHQMQLEAVKPTYGTLPSFSQPIEHPVAMDPPVVAHTQGGGIYKADARTIPKGTILQICRQRKHGIRTKLNHAVVTDHLRKITSQVLVYITQVEGFEVSESTQVEKHLDGHYLGEGKGSLPLTFFPLTDQVFFKQRLQFFTKIVDGTENFGNFNT